MKKTLAVLAMFFLTSVAHAESAEVRFLMSNLTPQGQDDNWESAYGLDVQLVNWMSPAVGMAACVGVSQWNAYDTGLAEYYPSSGTSVSARIDGDATVFPIGLSMLLRPISNHAAEVTLEAGFRYAVVSSDVSARYRIDDESGTVYGEDRIDLEDGFYGLVALDVAFPLSRFAKIGVGVGYQFDISKGDADFYGANIGENGFEASIVRIGFQAGF